MTSDQKSLTSSARLARNVIWNLIGTGAPLVVAVVTIPLLLSALGASRFGVLALAWMVVGYFSLFDLALGRAVTKLVAQSLGVGDEREVPGLVWTALTLMTALGFASAIAVWLLTPWLVSTVLNLPATLKTETETALRLLAISVPIVVTTTGLRGVMEAYQRFAELNLIRLPLGLLNFLGPLAVVPFSHDLGAIVAVLVVGRTIGWVAHLWLCLYIVPALRRPQGPRRELVKPLLAFGGWMTVSNVVGPLMLYLDRFLIGAMISMAAVTYYTTPYEVVTRISVVPAALMGVLFPAFAATFASDRTRAAWLFDRATTYIFLFVFPLTLVIVAMAQPALTVWLGNEFAAHSTLVSQWLAIGVFINTIAHAPFGLIQSAGRADLTAALHILELPFYVLLLWQLTSRYGINGAAVAWTLRVLVDTTLLFVIARHISRETQAAAQRVATMLSVGTVALLLAMMLPSDSARWLYLGCGLALFAVIAWRLALTETERDLIRSRVRSVSPFG